MTVDHRLLELLVCPVCKGPLEMLRDPQGRPCELACHADHMAFPVRDGIPVMLEQESRPFDDADPAPAPAPLP
jgi:uncharacterized protein YbaR (Trm112 family)